MAFAAGVVSTLFLVCFLPTVCILLHGHVVRGGTGDKNARISRLGVTVVREANTMVHTTLRLMTCFVLFVQASLRVSVLMNQAFFPEPASATVI